MFTDIFSSFDDSNQVLFNFNGLMWGFSALLIGLFSLLFWKGGSWSAPFWRLLEETILGQINRSLGAYLGGFTVVLSSLFFFLIMLNLIGLVPYVFSLTSHLVFAFSLGFCLWLVLIISGVAFNPSSVVASLLPMGAPSALNPFLVLIETVSILVRSITLSVRLMANMSAGHIVLTLVGNYLSMMLFLESALSLSLLVSIQVFYTIFEFAISLIQAYIFCLLLTLYSDEHPSEVEGLVK